MPEEIAPEKEKDSIGFRLGSMRLKTLFRLVKAANYQKPQHFMVALIDHLENIDGPFDIRDLKVVPKKK